MVRMVRCWGLQRSLSEKPDSPFYRIEATGCQFKMLLAVTASLLTLVIFCFLFLDKDGRLFLNFMIIFIVLEATAFAVWFYAFVYRSIDCFQALDEETGLLKPPSPLDQTTNYHSKRYASISKVPNQMFPPLPSTIVPTNIAVL